MASFSVMAFIAYPSLCYRFGWVGVTLLWVAIPATLFSALLFGTRWRRARIDSPVEYLETRYSPALRQVFAWQGIPVKVIDDAFKLFATGKFISACVGRPVIESILVSGGIMLVYTFMGGLWAVAVTDFVQFVVLTVGILVILPLSIQRAGGLGAIVSQSPGGFFRLTSDEYGWGYIALLSLLYSLAWSSINWSLIQRYYCVPKERDAVKVGLLVTALYVIGPPLMFFPALAARQFIPDLQDAGDVYPVLCAQLLPAGMLGLAIAAMFAATMSTLSSDFNVCASVLTNDVYKRLFRVHASQKELVLVGRITTLLVGVAGLGVAVLLAHGKGETLFDKMVTLFSIATAPVAVPMLLGLVSRRVSSSGAMAGFLCGTAVGLGVFALSRLGHEVTLAGIVLTPGADKFGLAGHVWKTEMVQFVSTSLTTLVVTLTVSLLVPVADDAKERVEAFLQRLRTPIGGLDEEKGLPAQVAHILSPFRVVGVSVLFLGLMLLVVVPWAAGTPAFWLDAALALALLVIGGLLTFWPTRREAASRAQS
jgi:SSS family transporter